MSEAGARDGAAHPLLAAVELHDDRERLALAQAVKDFGYEALYREPARVQAALARLDALCADCQQPAPAAQVAALADWLRGADAALRGRTAEAVAALDRAYDGLRAAGRSRDAAASQVPKLIALAMRGEIDAALACGERTRQELLAAADEAAAGRVEINLGSMLLRQHRYPEAAALYRCAAARLARRGDRRHSVMADIGLATALGWTADDDEAARIFERAAARVQAHGLDDLQPVIDGSRGLLALRRGRHADALRWLEAALRACERRGVPQPLAEARRDLADAYLALNLLPEALALYEQALGASRDAEAPTERAWATMQRGRALAGLGRSDAAMRDLMAARTLFEQLGHRVGAARAAGHAAALALASGLPAAALAQAEPARGQLAEAGAAGWAAEAGLLVLRSLRALGRLDEAEREAEALHGAAEAAGWDETACACLVERGLLARARGEAEAARGWLEQAADGIEARRAGLPADEFRTAYAGDRREAFEALLGLALATPQAANAPARVLEAMERSRAPALRLAAGRGEHATAAGTVARQQLDWTRAEWQRALALGGGPRATELAERCRHLEAELLERRRRARAAQGPGAAAPGVPAWSAHELQATLRDGQALVAYGWAGPRLAAVVATRQRLALFELAAGEVPVRAEQLRFQINALRFGAPGGLRHAALLQERAQAHLAALHRLLWQPLAAAVGDADEVIVVPSGLLHTLPFAALGPAGGTLLDRHAVLQTPSAALWCRQAAAAAPPAPQRLLALGLAGDALPHVRTELEAVTAAFGGPPPLLDAAATRSALAAALPGADVLHLACHGQFRADSPSFSSLSLADGPLALHDVVSLPAPRAAVVLSACETGLSRVAPGDEMLGLARGFLLAGAPRVLATLWTVDDSAMARLMAGFYRGWRGGLAPAQALRAAQRALRDERPHPYFWAATVLYGLN